MSLDYTSWVSTISTMTTIKSSNADFQTVLPSCIDYADNRIYRELNPILEKISDTSSSTMANNRNFTVPTTLGNFQVIDAINVIVGADPNTGTRNPCVPVSRDVLDFLWPSSSSAGVPTQWAYFSQANQTGQSNFANQTNIIFGPWPDTSYIVEVVGRIIPQPLSASNPTTFLTVYYPDLYIAASMVWMSGYLKNFGASSDDPRSAVSWESIYQGLITSARDWESRKRLAGASWSPSAVEPSAVPQRG